MKLLACYTFVILGEIFVRLNIEESFRRKSQKNRVEWLEMGAWRDALKHAKIES
jgi:uncharacterized protein with HEPN domain